jgi:hypothetical protein
MGSLDNVRKLRAMRNEKIELHEEYKKCKDSGDRIGMQRYKNLIKQKDKEILTFLDRNK